MKYCKCICCNRKIKGGFKSSEVNKKDLDSKVTPFRDRLYFIFDNELKKLYQFPDDLIRPNCKAHFIIKIFNTCSLVGRCPKQRKTCFKMRRLIIFENVGTVSLFCPMQDISSNFQTFIDVSTFKELIIAGNKLSPIMRI